MADEKKTPRANFDLEAEAEAALHAAQTMPPGPNAPRP
jgi:hypothetical protein